MLKPRLLAASLSLLIWGVGAAAAQAPEPKISTLVFGHRSPGASDPSWIAGRSALIVEATVKTVEPARWVKGHPVVRRRVPGDYAWHDVLFDRVRVVWRDRGVPPPPLPLRVRVYNADSPVVRSRYLDSPEFVLGERYVLCLTDVDTVAFSVGPPHWLCPSAGAFLISPEGVRRKGWDKPPLLSLSALMKALHSGLREEVLAHTRERRAATTKGITF